MRVVSGPVLAVAIAFLCGCFDDPDWGGLGGECGPQGQCSAGLVCAFGECSEPFGSGEECDVYAPVNTCEPPLVCVGGTCVEGGGEDQPCDPWDDDHPCDDGLYCVDGQCVELGGEGQPCIDYDEWDDTGDCDSGLECIGGICTGPTDEWVEQPGNPSRQWTRCPLGSDWDGWRCTGTATPMTWYPALEACPSGSQVPSLDDFIAILDDCDANVINHSEYGGDCASCSSSDDCDEMFTNEDILEGYDTKLKSGTYWTRTVGKDFGGDAKFAFRVDFGGGLYSVDTNPNYITNEEFTLCIK